MATLAPVLSGVGESGHGKPLGNGASFLKFMVVGFAATLTCIGGAFFFWAGYRQGSEPGKKKFTAI